MPGLNNSSSFQAQHLSDWDIYRDGIAVDDGLPAALTTVIDASRLPSAVGMQLWITPVRTAGAGTVTLTVYRENVGSLAAVQPHRQVGSAAAVATLSENRFTGLMPGVYRVLVTGIAPGAVWTLHYSLTTGLGLVIPVSGGAVNWGAIGGVLANQLDLAGALSTAAGTAAWGSISGTLSSQADLQNALNAKTPLATSTTFYVRTDGNDANDGSANDAGHAWLTLQHAVDVVSGKFIPGGVTVTVQLADGTYAGNTIVPPFTGGGSVIILGNATTPANVVLSASTGTVIEIRGSCRLRGLKLTNSGGSCLAITRQVVVRAGTLDFGTASSHHCRVMNGGALELDENYSITGSSLTHWSLSKGGIVATVGVAITVTLTGTPAFSGACVSVADVSTVLTPSTQLSFSGSATGTRYTAGTNGVINTVGGGANFFPGNVAGSVTTGGQYV